MKTLHVISVVSNPLNWNSRAYLFRKFIEDVLKTKQNLVDYSVEIHVVECLYAAQTTCLTEDLLKSIHYIPVSSDSVIWNKENLINIAISKLPSDWEYVAWVDGDIVFNNENWVVDTINVLDEHAVCQLWTEAHDLRVDGSTMMVHKSFCSQLDKARASKEPKLYVGLHSGYAWGATRQAIEALGGLYDVGILGSADNYMAWAFLGKVDAIIANRAMTEAEKQYLYDFQEKATAFANLGSVPGVIEHYYHGSKKDRGYSWRWKLAYDYDFDPAADVSFNADGVIQFAGNKPDLELAVLDYFQRRAEDSLEAVAELSSLDFHE